MHLIVSVFQNSLLLFNCLQFRVQSYTIEEVKHANLPSWHKVHHGIALTLEEIIQFHLPKKIRNIY